MTAEQTAGFVKRVADQFELGAGEAPGSVDAFQRAEDEALARWFLQIATKAGYAIVPMAAGPEVRS